MLQNEENKLMKKIQDTRKRADEIMKLKERNDKKFQERIMQKDEEEKRIEDDRDRQMAVRKLRQKAKVQREREIIMQRNSDFKEMKEKRLRGEKYQEQFKRQVHDQNRMRHDVVKDQEMKI